MPHGELRVVGERRPDADHHDVDERAQAWRWASPAGPLM